MRENKILVSLLIAAGVAVSPVSYAVTNGDEMMAVGAESMALGGTGVAHYVGAESTFANPAMLGKSTGTEVTGGIVLFKPDVTNTGFTATTPATSSANAFYVPDFSYSSRINDSLSYGVAMAGIGGMGVDYSGSGATYANAKTSLSILRIVPTIAYNKDNYGIGFSPVIQYGALGISYATANVSRGNGTTKTTGIGFNLGGYYNISSAMTVAAAYDSAINMNYAPQLSSAGTGFQQTFGDNLEQPAQIKTGIAYDFANNIILTADYKLIKWSNAAGYKEFGWKDENVVAIGGKYSGSGYWLGLGANLSNNPIGVFANNLGTTNGQNGVGNFFNNLMFPAIAKNSYTFGGGYSLTKGLELDGAYVMSPKVTSTVDASAAQGNAAGTNYNTTTHSQQSYSVSLRYKF